jgi:threonine dehydratase
MPVREADTGSAIGRDHILACHQLIGAHIRRTPVVEIDGTDLRLRCKRLSVKLELLQRSGSFKARGAFTNLLMRKVPTVGVVAASGGNHGAAVAYAAMKLGIPAKIFVPSVASPAKVDRIRSYAADLAIEGDSYADALAASEAWQRETGAMPVHAFDQAETIMGQGTLALELEQQVRDLDTLLVSVGGGGLIAGIAAWYAGTVKVVGVEPRASPTLTRAFEAGRPIDAPAGGLAADSLAPRRVGEQVYPIARAYVQSVLLVEDEDIRKAQESLWEALRIVAEPGGAAATAAVLSGVYEPYPDERVGVVVSGGNCIAVNLGPPP